eukprot:652376-Rhodomonas_salina.16
MEKEGCLPELEKDAGAPGPSVEEIIAREMDYHGGHRDPVFDPNIVVMIITMFSSTAVRAREPLSREWRLLCTVACDWRPYERLATRRALPRQKFCATQPDL